jgi:excisionase family DNA binding protein
MKSRLLFCLLLTASVDATANRARRRTKKPPASTEEPYSLRQSIDLKTAAARTMVPYSTLRQWIYQGRLPAYKIGHHVRIFVDDLEAMFTRIGE